MWELGQQALTNACCEGQTDRNNINFLNMFWDTWLDQYLGTQSSFAIDPGYLGMMNFSKYGPTPTSIHAGHNGVAAQGSSTGTISEHWGWSIQDPDLRILRVNTQTGASTLSPIVYDIEYKKRCVGRGPTGHMLFSHDYYGSFSGGMYGAPAALTCDGVTGVLEFRSV